MCSHLLQGVLSKAVDLDRARHCWIQTFANTVWGEKAPRFLGNKSLHLCDSQLKDIKSKRLISKSQGQWHFYYVLSLNGICHFFYLFHILLLKRKESIHVYPLYLGNAVCLISQVSTVKRYYIRLCHSLYMTCICF